jgi:hypothetical protein
MLLKSYWRFNPVHHHSRRGGQPRREFRTGDVRLCGHDSGALTEHGCSDRIKGFITLPLFDHPPPVELGMRFRPGDLGFGWRLTMLSSSEPGGRSIVSLAEPFACEKIQSLAIFAASIASKPCLMKNLVSIRTRASGRLTSINRITIGFIKKIRTATANEANEATSNPGFDSSPARRADPIVRTRGRISEYSATTRDLAALVES